MSVARTCKPAPRTVASLDRQFDRLVPGELRHLSSTHWTPVEVALRATELLCPTPHTRVLDIGSGVGKLCSIGALSTFGTWVGVEQHESLVAIAIEIARSLGVSPQTQFLQADAFDVDWNEFDALYFYNPFELALSDERLPRDDRIARVQERLATLPNGTRVVTFNGFGGVMPSTFELISHDHLSATGLDLTLWMQRPRRAGS